MISKEEATEIMNKTDKILVREECIKRIREITEHATFSNIPGIVSDLHFHAWQCYVYGVFKGCVIFSAICIEKALREELKNQGISEENFKQLINIAKKKGVINSQNERDAQYLRKELRNIYIHIKSKKLQQRVNMDLPDSWSFELIERKDALDAYKKATKILLEIYS